MIELRNITKKFGSLTAVDDLSLEIGPGEIYGFIGPNGAGKSTTMKILACLLRPDSGHASVGGHDVRTQGPAIRRILGYMPDFLGVYDDLTVDEYLQFFAAAFSIPRGKRRATIDGVLVNGGTGFTGRDSTPEAIGPLLDKEMPGFGELFRQVSVEEIGTSSLQSRAFAGLSNNSFVFYLPGSTSACRTAWEKIIRQQLDARTRPCNLATLRPRLTER